MLYIQVFIFFFHRNCKENLEVVWISPGLSGIAELAIWTNCKTGFPTVSVTKRANKLYHFVTQRQTGTYAFERKKII